MENIRNFEYMMLSKHKTLKTGTEGFQLEPCISVNLLGITIDHNLKFNTHVSNICKRVSVKVKSLGRIRNALLAFLQEAVCSRCVKNTAIIH